MLTNSKEVAPSKRQIQLVFISTLCLMLRDLFGQYKLRRGLAHSPNTMSPTDAYECRPWVHG